MNLGAFGNTGSATKSAAQIVQVLSPNGLEKFEQGQSVTIEVRSDGLATGTTVTLELSTNNGGSWTTLATSLALGNDGRASFAWTAGPVTETNTALIRVTANVASSPKDVSDEPFLITNSGTSFYVNDASTAGDEFTSATGDNLNSGKQPNRPMSSLRALLAVYDLDAGDVVQIDTGLYRLIANAVIGPEDSGVRIEGPSNAGAVLDRGDTRDSSAVIELVEADGVVLQRLTLTGGRYAVLAGPNADADDLELRDNLIYGNTAAAIYLAEGLGVASDRVTIAGNTIYQNGDGIRVEGADAIIQSNLIYDNTDTAVSVTGAGALIEGNRVYGHTLHGIIALGEDTVIQSNIVYGNGIGIETVSTRSRVTIAENTVFNNVSAGIRASGNALIQGNTVYEQDELGGTGIYAFGPESEVLDNVVHSNDQGIYAPAGATIKGNRVYNNAQAGIRATSNSVIEANWIYSNSIGVLGDFSFTGRIAFNAIYANHNQGILLRGIGALIDNNTIYQLVGDAIWLEGPSFNVTLRNNILWAESGYDLYVAPNAQAGFDSDYNLLNQGADPNAHVGFWGGQVRDSLSDWQAATGKETHSVAGDPLFVDLDGADNTLGYRAENGGYDGGLDDNPYLRRNSPAIDRGDAVAGAVADLEGYPAVDDPGTANLGVSPFWDLGAFEFRGSSLDVTPPSVTTTAPQDIQIGSPVMAPLNEIVLHFNEALNPISARSRSLFELVEAGPDGSFGAGIDRDTFIASLDYTPGSTTLRIGFVAPLSQGLYRLVVKSAPTNSLYDLAGNALDGDGNGSAGGEFVLTFAVNGPPELISATVNDGSPQRSRVSSLTLQFSENVSASLTASDLVLMNLTTSSVIAPADMAVSYDALTNRAMVTFPGLTGARLPDGNYQLTVTKADVTDASGLPLVADFNFEFYVLTGDTNGDRVVNDRDLYLIWQNLLKPAAQRNLNEDLTGDGQVTSADVDVVKGNYLATLPAPVIVAEGPLATIETAASPLVTPDLVSTGDSQPANGSADFQSAVTQISNLQRVRNDTIASESIQKNVTQVTDLTQYSMVQTSVNQLEARRVVTTLHDANPKTAVTDLRSSGRESALNSFDEIVSGLTSAATGNWGLELGSDLKLHLLNSSRELDWNFGRKLEWRRVAHGAAALAFNGQRDHLDGRLAP